MARRIVKKKSASAFKTALAFLLTSEKWNSADCRHLTRWASDEWIDDAAKAWSEIWMKLLDGKLAADTPDQEEGVARTFIREVIATRRVAEADYWPDYAKFADEAESLSKFLGSSGPPSLGLLLPPMPRFLDLVPRLQNLAETLREQVRNRMHISRENSDGLRPRRAFVHMISDYFRGCCGRPLNKQVAVLTDIAFPGKVLTTADDISAILKPTTRAGRSGKTKKFP
jgi:hypothetical protein